MKIVLNAVDEMEKKWWNNFYQFTQCLNIKYNNKHLLKGIMESIYYLRILGALHLAKNSIVDVRQGPKYASAPFGKFFYSIICLYLEYILTLLVKHDILDSF